MRARSSSVCCKISKTLNGSLQWSVGTSRSYTAYTDFVGSDHKEKQTSRLGTEVEGKVDWSERKELLQQKLQFVWLAPSLVPG